MSPGNSFILGSKGQGHEAQKTLPVWVMAFLWLLANNLLVSIIIIVGRVRFLPF